MSVLERMEAIGRSGLVISVCCGPCGATSFMWTVNVLGRNGEEFERAFAANTFEHAIEIAEMEITKRGWKSNVQVVPSSSSIFRKP